ncbi:MAG TPA: UDP-N-acetylglucosamine diphosphorylase/glucosamine-1-phosphate N-acetyltransferase [Oceanospirillaceae bacterium]|jgi:bifunctional UDP-N-acetylglucosamine pyrophosphorylase/glucosamine-1-phosphate N-acetyltransferase|nr:UDP-N-acetylglucosamine diphosphorylase/glucosamine-1-phosphate N-acetyltransferase [Oceanospirillaceae bacterium]
MSLEVIILAAGKGTRMRSDMPKVLHTLAGKPMLVHAVEQAQKLAPTRTHIIVGHGADQVEAQVKPLGAQCVPQEQQLGTGHAVAQAMPNVDSEATVLVLYGDVPLVPAALMQQLADQAMQGGLAILTVALDDSTGYGRIVRNDQGEIQAIVEHKDATPEQRQIKEINTGILAAKASLLNGWLPRIESDNAQGEIYLTDIVAMAVADGVPISHLQPEFAQQTQGVNDRVQLAELERWHQLQLANQLLRDGVQLADPSRFDLRGELTTGKDIFIDINAIIEGQVVLEDGVHIGPNCHLKDAHIGAGTHVFANSVIDQARVAKHCNIGPFARLRPGTVLEDGAKVGNFVETKKTTLGKGSKANHFTYLGDTVVGEKVNIGAGTITCNYDGVNKFQTNIEDGAFIGSNSSIVAPVTIGAGATVGAGSTITKDVADNNLAIARGKQRNLASWAKPVKS